MSLPWSVNDGMGALLGVGGIVGSGTIVAAVPGKWPQYMVHRKWPPSQFRQCLDMMARLGIYSLTKHRPLSVKQHGAEKASPYCEWTNGQHDPLSRREGGCVAHTFPVVSLGYKRERHYVHIGKVCQGHVHIL